MARARLRDKHQENLKQKLELLKAEQRQQEIKEEHSDYIELNEGRTTDVIKEEKEQSEDDDR